MSAAAHVGSDVANDVGKERVRIHAPKVNQWRVRFVYVCAGAALEFMSFNAFMRGVGVSEKEKWYREKVP